MTNSIQDLEQADCLLIIGSNTTENHPLIARRLMRARDRGAKIIVADPRRVHIAGFADLHLRHKPGTDVALINGLIQVILSEQMENRKFIDDRTEGFDDLKQAVAGYTPDVVEKITGVPGDSIRASARMFAQAANSAIIYCMGVTQHTTGVDSVKSCANLAMLTGNIGRPGTGVNPLRGQNNVQGACDMGALSNFLPGYGAVTDPDTRNRFEQLWGGPIPEKAGYTVMEMMNAAASGEVTAMYIMGENPMVSDPDLKHVKEALERLEFLVVQDIFLTETATMADVVLPAACFAEKTGTVTNTERRVQMMNKAVNPPGEAKPDWEIACMVGRQLGLNGFDFNSAEEVFTEIRKAVPQYAGFTFARLGTEGLHWPCKDEEHPGTPILHSGSFSRGKGKFHDIEFKPPVETPDETYPFVLTTGRTAFQYHTGTMTRRSAGLNKEVPSAFVEINPEDASEFGIRNGGPVKVSSRRGELIVQALVTDRVPARVLFIPFHFAETAANVLTNPAFDPLAKIPEYKVCAAAISAV